MQRRTVDICYQSIIVIMKTGNVVREVSCILTKRLKIKLLYLIDLVCGCHFIHLAKNITWMWCDTGLSTMHNRLSCSGSLVMSWLKLLSVGRKLEVIVMVVVLRSLPSSG